MAERIAAPPQPPRLTGNTDKDFQALVQWTNDFYTAVVRENFFVQAAGQFDAGDFDPSSLPDPASATVASAQQTANEAYGLAASALSQFGAVVLVETGQVTVDGTNTDIDHTFETEQADTDYFVIASPIGGTGTPASNSNIIASITKATDKFTLAVDTAPGSGNTFSFDFLVCRAETES